MTPNERERGQSTRTFQAFLERAVADGLELHTFMAKKGWDVQRGLAAIETCRTAIEENIKQAEAKK